MATEVIEESCCDAPLTLLSVGWLGVDEAIGNKDLSERCHKRPLLVSPTRDMIAIDCANLQMC